jgi:hypothetical protein
MEALRDAIKGKMIRVYTVDSGGAKFFYLHKYLAGDGCVEEEVEVVELNWHTMGGFPLIDMAVLYQGRPFVFTRQTMRNVNFIILKNNAN